MVLCWCSMQSRNGTLLHVLIVQIESSPQKQEQLDFSDLVQCDAAHSKSSMWNIRRDHFVDPPGLSLYQNNLFDSRKWLPMRYWTIMRFPINLFKFPCGHGPDFHLPCMVSDYWQINIVGLNVQTFPYDSPRNVSWVLQLSRQTFQVLRILCILRDNIRKLFENLIHKHRKEFFGKFLLFTYPR